MRNKDTGEFELVVGDKQLLSGFFIGVLLLAVVFAMGYVLGQNSPKSAKVPAETAAAVPPSTELDARPQPASPAPPPSTDSGATPPAQTADTAQPAAAPPVEAPPQPTTMPARDASEPPAKPAPPPAADLSNATYWQVTATASRNSADAMYQSLKGHGFPALTRPGPNNWTVVWVGPYFDKESLARAKKQLEDAGFNQIIKKP
jgi:cell division septation protein DedD